MEFAMPDAVSKIDQKPNTHPDQQPEPGIERKGNHLCQTDNCPQDRNQWNERGAEWSWDLRLCLSKHNNADANDREGQQSTDRDQLTEHADRQDTCEYHCNATGKDSADIRGFESGMDFRKNRGEKAIVRHRIKGTRLSKQHHQNHRTESGNGCDFNNRPEPEHTFA